MIITYIVCIVFGYILARLEIMQRILYKFRYKDNNIQIKQSPEVDDLDRKLERLMKLTEVPKRKHNKNRIVFPNHITLDFDEED